MLTPLGKELRRLRIDRDWLLQDMAAGIGVSPSFLSAIENGRKQASQDIVQRICDWAELTEEKADELHSARLLSRKSIDLILDDNVSETGREAALVLARTFNSLDDSKLTEIRRIVEGKKR